MLVPDAPEKAPEDTEKSEEDTPWTVKIVNRSPEDTDKSEKSVPWNAKIVLMVLLDAIDAGMKKRRKERDLSSWRPGENDFEALLSEAEGEELKAYWEAHKAKWATPLRLIEFDTAFECGELYGQNFGMERDQGTEKKFFRMGEGKDLGDKETFLELFKNGELLVPRRYRNMTPEEPTGLAALWEQVCAARAHLKAAGTWDDIVRETEEARKIEYGRAQEELEQVYMVGGMRRAFTELTSTAGDTPTERLITELLMTAVSRNSRQNVQAAGKKEISAGIQDLPSGRKLLVLQVKRSQIKLALGVALVVVVGLALAFGGGGGSQDSLERTLELLQ